MIHDDFTTLQLLFLLLESKNLDSLAFKTKEIM